MTPGTPIYNTPVYTPVTVEEVLECCGEWLFTDGGLIGSNPSKLGGTWAWIRVRDGRNYESGSGITRPGTIGLPAVSNNVSELFAMVRGIRSLPADWTGTIASDSHATLCRRFPGAGMVGVPKGMALFARQEFARVLGRPGVRWVLLSGHPTRRELAAGVGKGGYPVSQHNVDCDARCTALAAEFKAEREKGGAA